MELKSKNLGLKAGFPIIVLTQKNADRLGILVGGRAQIYKKSIPKKILSVIVDISNLLVKDNEVGVSKEIIGRFGLKGGQKIYVDLGEAPDSLELIKKKLNKEELSEKEIEEIIEEVVDNSLSGPEIALFISAMYSHGMTLKETAYLIEAILKTGNTMKFRNKYVVDKHCIGGIPGNRTTPIVVSICTAAGLLMPKNSSRAITSAAGTADVIETLAKIEFTMPELKKIVKKTGGCMVWGGALGIVPADSKIIKIEKSLTLDPEAQLLASIMSKKLASDSNYILIDIPYGKTAKVSKRKALHLKKKFESLGRFFHKKLVVVLTKGKEPIGNGIGPELEMGDVIKTLKQESDRPLDLEKKSIFLAGKILEIAKKAKEGKGEILAQKLLAEGKAFKKFKEIIKAQKGKIRPPKIAKYKKHILTNKSGKIKLINNKGINALARVAGCPNFKSSGIYLYHHVGDKVKKGDKLMTIFSESRSRLKQAEEFYKRVNPLKISLPQLIF